MNIEALRIAAGRFVTLSFVDGSQAFCFLNAVHTDLPGRELNLDVISIGAAGPLLTDAPEPGVPFTLPADQVTSFRMTTSASQAGTEAKSGGGTHIGYAESVLQLPDMLAEFDLPVVLFVGAAYSNASVDVWGDVAERLLHRKLVYLVAWGPGCGTLEELFDEVYSYARDVEETLIAPPGSVLMTTSHPKESMEEAVWFALNAARPSEEYGEQFEVLLVGIGEPDWIPRISQIVNDGGLER